MSARQRESTKPKKGKARKIWMVDFVYRFPNGHKERIRKDSSVQTRRGAEQYERLLRQSLADGTFGRKEGRTLFEDFALNEFMPNYSATNNKFTEYRSKCSALRNHLIPAFGGKPLAEIGVRDVEAFKAQKIEQKLSPKTINNNLVCLGKILRVAEEWELIAGVPRIKMLKVPKPEFDFLSFTEADALVEAMSPEWRAMLVTAVKTGLRRGELLALRWKDVDLETKRLVVRRNLIDGRFGTPKSGKNREVPLCDTVVAELREHRHLRSELVFCREDGRPLNPHDVLAALHDTCDRAELRHIGLHTMRHTFASHLAMRGVPMQVIQELLGHSTLVMTMRYAHLSPDVKRDYVNMLDLRGNDRATAGSQPANQTESQAN